MTSSPRLGSMARVTGRGFLITFVFNVAVQILAFVQGLVVPRLLGPENIGLYALAVAVVAFGSNFQELGVNEKLIQERDVDLPRAYSVAFTLEMTIASGLFAIVAAVSPLVADLYGRPELAPLIVVLGLTLYTNALMKLPGAVHLRQLQYGRQNLLQSVRPVVSFAVTVPLAFLGAEVWALVGGALAATFAAMVVVGWGLSLRPRLRVERALVRRYVAYGWPIWIANVLSLSTTWGGAFVISTAAGITVLGYFTLAQQLAQRAFRLDNILGRSLFPALARAQDDTAGQRRAFTATNRLTMLWAGPLGFGLFVFAPDLVHLVLGDEWEPAIFLLRMQGLAVATGSIGYSWDVFFRARGNTKPSLIFSAISEAWVFVVLLPAVVLWDVTGAAWAIASLGVLAVALRQIFIRRIFPGINLVANAWRELVATAGATAGASIVREVVGPPSGFVAFGAQLVVFGVFTFVAVIAIDRAFLLDMYRRLRGRRRGGPRPGPLAATEPVPNTEQLLSPISPAPPADPTGAAISRPAKRLAVTEELSIPGAFPLFLTPDETGGLWVTLRDSSQIAHVSSLDEPVWRSWRFPAYPHVACVDGRGRAWFALTIASAVGAVDPVTGWRLRRRLGRSRELLVAAWDHQTEACLVVDAGNRLLWSVTENGQDSVPLPPELRRPDFIVVGPDGSRWITDTASPHLGRLRRDGSMTVVELPWHSRVAVLDHGTGRLWIGHNGRPLLSVVDVAGDWPAVLGTYELPGIPFGLAVHQGAVWAALPADDAIVRCAEGDVDEVVELGAGSAPHTVAVVVDRVWAATTDSNRLVAVT